MFICSKLEQNLSKMEARTSVSIQRVNWNHLLAFKAEIIQKQALFLFRCRTALNNKQLAAHCPVCSVFPFVLSTSPPRSFFRLNHVRKVRKRCSHSRFSCQAIILEFFDRIVSFCRSCFSVDMGDRGYFPALN